METNKIANGVADLAVQLITSLKNKMGMVPGQWYLHPPSEEFDCDYNYNIYATEPEGPFTREPGSIYIEVIILFVRAAQCEDSLGIRQRVERNTRRIESFYRSIKKPLTEFLVFFYDLRYSD